MRVELYKLKMPENFNLGRRIERIHAKELQTRTRSHGDDLMRLEILEKKGALWFLDFVRIRMSQGPAKTALGEPSTGFSLRADQGFGEETAMLWDTSTDWCIMQYNHHSLKPNSIAEYVSDYNEPGDKYVRFVPRLDPKLLAKLRAKRIVTRFKLEVAPSEIDDNDFNEGMGLVTAAKSFQSKGADVVTIELSTRHGRGRSLDIDLEKVREWIGSIFAKSNRDAIISASASIKKIPDERVELIDLLAQPITAKVEVLPGEDRRLPREIRWNELATLHELWAPYMTS